MKKIMLFTMMFSCCALWAQEEDVDTFVQWDLDRDGYIMDDEYDEFWEKSNFTERWDKDGDGLINEEEWNNGSNQFYRDSDGWSDNEYNNFDSWDMDGDGNLSGDEFREGNYSTWDFDRDGRIAEEEYNNFYRLD